MFRSIFYRAVNPSNTLLFYWRKGWIALCFVFTLAPAANAQAHGACFEIFRVIPVTEISFTPQIKKWLIWETSITREDWLQARLYSPIPVVMVERNTVQVELLNRASIVGLEGVVEGSNFLPWFKHPYNTDFTVPHSTDLATSYITGYHTASRTMVAEINGRLVSIKMPTNRPFGSEGSDQPAKVRMDKDLQYSVKRSAVIAQIDKKIGFDPQLIALKELIAVKDRETGNGYLIRDMEPLQDGHYYLPAHQIPTVGREIAQKFGQTGENFWLKHYAVPMGRLQAKLFYRYGMEVRSINPQNFLIQLDQNFMPTGTLVWRDLAESHLIEPVARALGLENFVEMDMQNGGWGIHAVPDILSWNLHWLFGDSAESPMSSVELKKWDWAHDQAFIDELKLTIGYELPPVDPKNWGVYQLTFRITEALSEGADAPLMKKILEWHGSRTREFAQ